MTERQPPLPPADMYRQNRTKLFSQGDIFADLPFNDLELSDDAERQARIIRVWRSNAMLITPTDAMRARGATDRYSGPPTRTVIPVLDLDKADVTDLERLTTVDGLFHYMYLPEDPVSKLRRSIAVLSMPTTVSAPLLERFERVTQLSVQGTRQLQLKLVEYSSSLTKRLEREDFNPWPD